MTLQETYAGIREYFSRPGAELAGGSGQSCYYRHPNGSKCAVGCLIPDEQYDPEWDHGTYAGPHVFDEVVRTVWPEQAYDADFREFLRQAQVEHDTSSSVTSFLIGLDRLARDRGLEVAA